MRWVILFFGAACLLIWDGWFNGGVWTDAGMRGLTSMLSGVTGYFK